MTIFIIKGSTGEDEEYCTWDSTCFIDILKANEFKNKLDAIIEKYPLQSYLLVQTEAMENEIRLIDHKLPYVNSSGISYSISEMQVIE